MLNKKIGFKALMRFLRDVYLNKTSPGGVPKKNEFLDVLKRIKIKDHEFNIENFRPGTSGESLLYRRLQSESRLGQ